MLIGKEMIECQTTYNILKQMQFQRLQDTDLSFMQVYVNKSNTVLLEVNIKQLEIIFISTILSCYQYTFFNKHLFHIHSLCLRGI